MSARNFGLTGNRAALGADVRRGPIIASGGPRESSIQLAGKTSRPANSRGASSELSIAMERATKWALILAAVVIGAAFSALLFVVSLIIDYGLSDSPF